MCLGTALIKPVISDKLRRPFQEGGVAYQNFFDERPLLDRNEHAGSVHRQDSEVLLERLAESRKERLRGSHAFQIVDERVDYRACSDNVRKSYCATSALAPALYSEAHDAGILVESIEEQHS